MHGSCSAVKDWSDDCCCVTCLSPTRALHGPAPMQHRTKAPHMPTPRTAPIATGSPAHLRFSTPAHLRLTCTVRPKPAHSRPHPHPVCTPLSSVHAYTRLNPASPVPQVMGQIRDSQRSGWTEDGLPAGSFRSDVY